jgi:hypothetical protein
MGILSTEIRRKLVTPAFEPGSTDRFERANTRKRRRVDSAHFQWGFRWNDMPNPLCPVENIWLKISFGKVPAPGPFFDQGEIKRSFPL